MLEWVRSTQGFKKLTDKVGFVEGTLLVASTNFSDQDSRLRPFVENANVLPNPDWAAPLNWTDLQKLVPKSKKGVLPKLTTTQILDFTTIPLSLIDDHIQENIFKPRTKIDLSIRRSRWPDLIYHAKRTNSTDTLHEVLSTLNTEWDYIAALNMVTATYCFGIDWFRRWKTLGAFDYDLSHYILVTKKISDVLKTKNHSIPDWTNFVECSNLGGYRNPPFPGFDVVEETRKLAEGGLEFDTLGYKWEDVVDKALPMDYHRVNFVPFKDFVTSAQWLTAGASSEGKLEVVIDGKITKIKARKNFVPDVVDLNELAETARTNKKQENYSIVKSELGKLRMAVASDLKTYLQMTWINYLLGGAYKDWPGSTIEEDPVTQSHRMGKMLELAAKKFGLPYDYASFDHQPTTEQLLAIVRKLIVHARLNVPPEHYSEFDEIAANIIEGYLSATLEVRTGADRKVFKVTGGVMSGLRWTTVLGNGWNTCMTWLAQTALKDMGMSIDGIERYIRGDDSAIFTKSWQQATLMNESYGMIGVQGGAGKYSVRKHAMEFLRVWYSDRCYGYPARAIPGITQRKPWSSAPWTEDSVIKAIYETFKTLERRLGNLSSLWNSLASRWCQLHQLPRSCLSAPTALGGFGFERVTQLTKIVPPVPKMAKPTFTFNNMTDWREKQILKTAQLYGLAPDADWLKQEAISELSNVIASDDVPAISRELRNQWKQELKKQKYTSVPLHLKSPSLACQNPFFTVSDLPDQYKEMLDRTARLAPEFGSGRKYLNVVQDWKRFKNFTDLSLKQWIDRWAPELGRKLNSFSKNWHIAEKLDYLLGDIPTQTYKLHPVLNRILAQAVAACCSTKGCTRLQSLLLGSYLEDQLLHTELATRMYNW